MKFQTGSPYRLEKRAVCLGTTFPSVKKHTAQAEITENLRKLAEEQIQTKICYL